MAQTASIGDRIKAEFDARAKRVKETEQQRSGEAQAREARLAQFTKTCEDLKAIWRPRFEEFSRQFGEKIKVTPTVTPALREATLNFITDLANMTLKMSVSTTSDVKQLVLDYDLLIVPVFIEYERHARLEMPLDKIDRQALGAWIDDRLMDCVKAYLAMQENEHYLQRAMVQDPISKTRFLREEAAAKFEHNGKTEYFSSEESLRQFKQKHQLEGAAPAKPAAAGSAPAAKPAGKP